MRKELALRRYNKDVRLLSKSAVPLATKGTPKNPAGWTWMQNVVYNLVYSKGLYT